MILANHTKGLGLWIRSVEFVCDLACLREAASAKAGAWDLVIILILLCRSVVR